MTRKKSFAVITCFNEKPSVLRCLAQLKQINPEIHVVLVDDGSSDGTSIEVGLLYPEVTVVRGDGSMWWSGATNAGIRVALNQGASTILFLNNDCVLPAGGIGAMIDACENNDSIIVSAAIGDLADGSPVCFGGKIARLGLEYIGTAPIPDSNGLAPVEWLPGHAVVFPVSVFERVGDCDAKHFPQYFGDADFSLRARAKGYRLMVMPDIMVLNDRSQTGLSLKVPIRPRNLWKVLTHQRSMLRLTDNVRFHVRHRQYLRPSHLFARYERIPEALIQELLDKLGIRDTVRRLRH